MKRSVACTSYVLALVTSYNAMIGMKDKESKVFRAQCKDSLRELENNMTAVASGTRKRAKAILHFSLVYDLFYRLHRCYIRFKIKQAQKRVRGSET